MSVWKIVIWLLATLGVAGTIALFVFFPTIVGKAFAAMLRVLTLVLSYRSGCALLAAIAMGFAVDYWRHSRDDAAYAQRTALFEHAQKARDAQIAEDARQTVWLEIANETAAQAVTDNQVKEFDNELRPLPAADTTCRVGPAVERLRVISGRQVDRRSKGGRGMPKARRASASPLL